MTFRQTASLIASVAIAGTTAAADLPPDPLFDWPAILNDPVDAAVLSTETTNGIVFQSIEYTTRLTNGGPERIQGIYAFPEGGTNLPAVFWSMGGMAAASRSFPGQLAERGYACLAITLPHKIRNSFRVPFDTAHPESANLTLLARDQLRAITMLAQRPEVDANRIACAGASYGGVFATLIAGADARVKAGFSFFGGGHHELGTSLPQFLKLETEADVAAWSRTIDPAWRLKNRDIPFLWGVAFNDHWFHFPALMQTFRDAGGTDKRMVIMPHWQHGFPVDIDNALLGFLDTTPVAARPKPAYNQPGSVRVENRDGKVVASFDWTGSRPVAKAELVVSYGEVTPWLGWPKRAAFVFPATVSGNRATAELPVPSRQLPLVAWGNLTDTGAVTVSTLPVTLQVKDLASLPIMTNLVLNAMVGGDLDPAGIGFYRQSGEPLAGEPEADPACSGGQSLRVETNLFTIREHLHSVPGVAHRLTVRLRAKAPVPLTVSLTPMRPPQWSAPVAQALVAKDPRLAPLLPKWKEAPVPLSVTATVGTNWQDVVLEAPVPTAPVEGYRLDITNAAPGTPFWFDTLHLQPVWP